MRGRVVAVITAILLAAVGAVLLTAYVHNADERAMEGMEATSVLVVTTPIPEGAEAEALAEFVEVAKLPRAAVPEAAVSSLEDLAGMVATVDLEPGEQVLASRFADPDTLLPPGEVEVPDGLQRVTVLLDAERVVGGRVEAGDKVGVFVSLEEPKRTRMVQSKVLVVRVAGGIVATEGGGGEAAGPEPVLEGDVMVTLAVNTPAAEEIVFGMEHGRVWLTLQPDEASTDGSRVVNDTIVEPQESVYQ